MHCIYGTFFFYVCFSHDTDCSVVEVVQSVGSDWLTCDNIDTSNDLVIAQMLQSEFDAEHNQKLKHVEEKLNGTNKGCNFLLLLYLNLFYLNVALNLLIS
jgi:hypothetical protein